MKLGLKGKIALVTGGSAGLGFAAAYALASEGVQVVINSRSEENLKAAAKKIGDGTGQEVGLVVGDLTETGKAEELIKYVLKNYGAVDILVANAGGPPSGMFDDLSKEDWQKSTRLTLYPSIDLSRAALPSMKEKGWGRIIFITSVSVKQPIDNLIISNTLRAGVTGFSKSISNQYAQFGITVNTVCPGYTNTERLKELAKKISGQSGASIDDVYKTWADTTPAKRIGEPDELAALITFLSSEKASYITGTVIAVDGGHAKGLL